MHFIIPIPLIRNHIVVDTFKHHYYFNPYLQMIYLVTYFYNACIMHVHASALCACVHAYVCVIKEIYRDCYTIVVLYLDFDLKCVNAFYIVLHFQFYFLHSSSSLILFLTRLYWICFFEIKLYIKWDNLFIFHFSCT